MARDRAGERGERLAWNATARGIPLEPLLPDRIDLPLQALKPGRNILAIQGLTAEGSPDVYLLPILLAPYRGAWSGGRERFRTFLSQAGPERRLQVLYLEGRLLAREGELEAAAQKFRDAVEMEELSAKEPEPAVWLGQTLRSLGRDVEAEERLRAFVHGALYSSEQAWIAWLGCVGGGPEEALRLAPPARAPDDAASAVRWVLEQLRDKRAVRIDADASEPCRDAGGKEWAADRFIVGGGGSARTRANLEGKADAELINTERWFRKTGPAALGYQIPLPSGRYRVTLCFAETHHLQAGSRRFGVLLEDQSVLTGYEPVAAGFAVSDWRSFEARVDDGALDIELRPEIDNPNLAALEVVPVPEPAEQR